jgi:hypothetical protein
MESGKESGNRRYHKKVLEDSILLDLDLIANGPFYDIQPS